VPSFPNVLEFLPHEFPGLRRWRFALATVFFSSLQGLRIRHDSLLVASAICQYEPEAPTVDISVAPILP
jgi:hypothetical protein